MDLANKKGADFTFTHYLMIAKKFRMKLPGGAGKKRRSTKKPMEQEIYSNGEEEFFAEVNVTSRLNDVFFNLK